MRVSFKGWNSFCKDLNKMLFWNQEWKVLGRILFGLSHIREDPHKESWGRGKNNLLGIDRQSKEQSVSRVITKTIQAEVQIHKVKVQTGRQNQNLKQAIQTGRQEHKL